MVLELTPSFAVIDPRFRKLAFPYVHVEKLYTGCRWAEGPAWFAAGRYLVWSDIPNDRMLRWDETDGSVSVFRQPALNSNGHTVDRQGRLVSCEHRSRSVSRTEHDGTRTVLASHFEGKRFNSPNDVVVKSDGSVWFSDPSYGIDSDTKATRRQAKSAHVTSTASMRQVAVSPSSHRISCNPMGSRSRRTNRCCTSPTPVSRTGRTARTTCGASRFLQTAIRFRAARCSQPARSVCSTGFVSTFTATCGFPLATACVATQATVRCWARS